MDIDTELKKLVINCHECNKEFIKVIKNQRFCCDVCRKRDFRKRNRKLKIMGRDLFAA
jgi:hypothetical protein